MALWMVLSKVMLMVLPGKIHCDEVGRLQVQAWDLHFVQAMHAWCRERLDTIVDVAAPGG